ncbi:MAG: DNA/RNA nuclease SfsA [Oscillospiraceae bacterium]|nr:DNA/RNA nuclease SfsA [Oscillospiraceae bacterium]
MSESEIVYGTFKEEIKNRFLCTVSIDGTDTVCYIPSSCRLSNFIDLSNRTVMLQPIKKKNARTKYAVYAVKYRRSYVPLNLSVSNRVLETEISRRYFSFLGKRKSVFREKVIDGYKSDLYIADTDTVIEVKSILSFNKSAIFPTVFSERANRQLEELLGLLVNGHKVCYMLVSMCSSVESIRINNEQEEYYGLFVDCIRHGMTVSAISLGMKNDLPYVRSRIDVIM